MKWIEFKITTKRDAVEAITERLYGFGVKGVAIEDPMDLKDICSSDTFWDYVDEEIMHNIEDKVIIKAYFPENTNYEDKLLQIQRALLEVKDYFDIGDGKVETSDLNEEDWSNSWKKYYKPVKITDRVVIKPTWEDYEKENDEIVIDMDPGMAFGTGTHETTRMCMKLIEKYVTNSSSVLDLGCGTGILGICALKLGAEKAVGIDIDKVAVKVAKTNSDLNNVSDKLTIYNGDLLKLVEGKFDLVTANIIADAIIELSHSIKNYMKENTVFISSGIIKERQEDVLKALEKDFQVLDLISEGEWVAISAKLK